MVARTTPPPRQLVARSWDRLARDLLQRGLDWTVHSVFAQACNLVAADGTLLALIMAPGGNGPAAVVL